MNILSHVAGALAASAPLLPHGVVTIDGVAVSRNGRIRVTDFAMSPLVPVVVRLGRSDPGLRARGAGRLAADRGVRRLLPRRPALRGPGRRAAAQGLHAPEPGGAGRVEGGRPDHRARDVVHAAQALPERRRAGRGGGRGAVRRAAAVGVAPAAAAALSVGSGVHSDRRASNGGPADSQPSLAESLAGARSGVGMAAAPSPGTPSSSMSAVLAERDVEKWLISKGKLDYGPFNLGHIAQQIAANQILPGPRHHRQGHRRQAAGREAPAAGRDGRRRAAQARRAAPRPRRGAAREPGEAARHRALRLHRHRRAGAGRRRLPPGAEAQRRQERGPRRARVARGRIARGQDQLPEQGGAAEARAAQRGGAQDQVRWQLRPRRRVGRLGRLAQPGPVGRRGGRRQRPPDRRPGQPGHPAPGRSAGPLPDRRPARTTRTSSSSSSRPAACRTCGSTGRPAARWPTASAA